jgi:hypothetical protein
MMPLPVGNGLSMRCRTVPRSQRGNSSLLAFAIRNRDARKTIHSVAVSQSGFHPERLVCLPNIKPHSLACGCRANPPSISWARM